MTAKHIGFDVSRYQRPDAWSWPGLAAMSATIVARATYGTRPDETFPEYAAKCREHGVRLGAYHFFRQSQPWGEQVDAFLTAADTLKTGDVLPVIDLEDNSKFDGPIKAAQFSEDAERMASFVRDVYGGLVVYMSSYFPAVLGNPEWLKDPGYRIWLADYAKEPGSPRTLYSHRWNWHQPAPEWTHLYEGRDQKGNLVEVDHIYANPEHEPGVMLIGEMPNACA